MLSFKSTFSLSSFTFIKGLFSSLLSAIEVVSSAYLKLLIFLPAISIPACASSSLHFGILHDASLIAQSVKNLSVMQETQVQFLGREDLLEKEMATHSHILAWRILWTVCSMSSSNCCFLTCIQISQEAGKVVQYSHLLKNFPVCGNPHSQRLWHSQ